MRTQRHNCRTTVLNQKVGQCVPRSTGSCQVRSGRGHETRPSMATMVTNCAGQLRSPGTRDVTSLLLYDVRLLCIFPQGGQQEAGSKRHKQTLQTLPINQSTKPNNTLHPVCQVKSPRIISYIQNSHGTLSYSLHRLP